jgi:hypothetical protein
MVDEVGRAAAAEGIERGFVKGGTVVLARTPGQLARARTEVDPARLVRGLADTVERRAVRIYEQTPVVAIGLVA